MAALQPAEIPQRRAGIGVRHCCFVYDEYELASLFRRVHGELSHADGRTGVSQLCVRCRRHCLAIVVIRGIARKETDKLGNFWVDTTRCLLWVLLPVCALGSLLLVSQGVVQNLKPYTTVDLIQPYTAQVTGADGKTTTQTVTQQVIAQGPVASQEMVKEFGTNGGGFFNAKVPIRLKIRLRFQTSLRWFSFSRLPPD
jgi:hypothetical protein